MSLSTSLITVPTTTVLNNIPSTLLLVRLHQHTCPCTNSVQFVTAPTICENTDSAQIAKNLGHDDKREFNGYPLPNRSAAVDKWYYVFAEVFSLFFKTSI
uniref:Uncharacterized protein n=1 Tax=Heterorhabditis bacteriophora TaxID=37862 RepID=A0A1I7X0F4_HETBA